MERKIPFTYETYMATKGVPYIERNGNKIYFNIRSITDKEIILDVRNFDMEYVMIGRRDIYRHPKTSPFTVTIEHKVHFIYIQIAKRLLPTNCNVDANLLNVLFENKGLTAQILEEITKDEMDIDKLYALGKTINILTESKMIKDK